MASVFVLLIFLPNLVILVMNKYKQVNFFGVNQVPVYSLWLGWKLLFLTTVEKNICLIYIVATIRKADGVRETPDRIAIFLNFQNDSQFLLIKVFLHENSQQICVKTLGTVASIEVNYSPPTMFIITLNFRTT